MSDNHKNGYHKYYPEPSDHAYSVDVPVLPGAGGLGATGELTIYVSVHGTIVEEIGRQYEGPWAYAVVWCGDTVYLHGDVLRPRSPITHAEAAMQVAEVASVVAGSAGGDEESLSERLAYFAHGELPPEGFSWTKDSAIWQVANGERATPRFTSALDYLSDHYAETPTCPTCGDVMDYCRRCA